MDIQVSHTAHIDLGDGGKKMLYTRFEALNIRHDYQSDGYVVKLEKQDNGLWMVYILTNQGWEAV